MKVSNLILCPIRANALALENKTAAVDWTHVCVCMLSLTMFACPVIDCLVLFCSCPVRVLSCHWLVDVTHCFSLVEFFTCCDMDLTTQVWCLPRLPQLQAKRREWPITRKKRLLRLSVHVVMNVFGKGFGFPWHPQVCHFDKRTLSSWWWLSLTIHKFQKLQSKI